MPNPNVRTYRVPCSTWLPNGGGTSTGSYPAKNSSGFTCHFRDGGYFGGGTQGILFQCRPLSDRASNGRIDYYVRLTDGSLYYSSYRCLYPTDAYAPIERKTGEGKVYTGGRGDFLLTNASGAVRHSGGGERTDTTGYVTRNVDLSTPERFTGAWQPSFDAKTGVTAAGEPRYGYYRLDWTLDYRLCTKWEYPSWLRQSVRIDCSRKGTDRPTSPYTYSCDSNPPLRAGVRSGANFAAARCSAAAWSCDIKGHIRVGGASERVSVMRNGQSSIVSWHDRSVRDPNNRVRVLSWQQRSEVEAGSTPKNPAVKRDNDEKEYFQASWKWGTWNTINRDGELFFYWASDPGAPFRWETEYRFHGQFLVPTQTSMNSGSQNRWVKDYGYCGTHKSPQVEVLRSVSSLPRP
ncbi:hypothetical protein FQ330_03105 [Agrococcus sediminis]|uniref:Uncharacterized protein n=1 Tax=Agrococcus sediminis TaxID=2599924 RepID=A0A5M8QJS1_9MICO|nr:hypothetical protein [Agrococcus sediminis]KAA6436407.1 hypothetical protein FQ330_03105 [Agrococcus sediminis]